MNCEPLFQAGFKDIGIDELEDVFVSPFENSERRAYLLERFMALIDKFKETGISSEVWIDGSFATKKPEPGDIDMIFFVDGNEANRLDAEKQAILKELNDQKISQIRGKHFNSFRDICNCLNCYMQN
ncbi:MAG: DUF6932 family protein [Flavobacteriaceae bacterium]